MIDESNELAEDTVVTDPSDALEASAESAPSSDMDMPNVPEPNVPEPDASEGGSPESLDNASMPSDTLTATESTASAASEVSETPELSQEELSQEEPAQEESPQDDSQQNETAQEEDAQEEDNKAEETETKVEEAVVEGDAADEAIEMDWYILKVQSNREKSITEALERRVKIAGLDEYFEQIVVPTEKITEFKGGRKRVVNRKLYPGYILVHMHINDDTWFLVRETPGIGDFTGSGGKPTPMLPHEVQRIIVTEEDQADEAPKLKISFNVGDRVKINEGTFESFEGEVSTVDQTSGHITVMINIFGRSTPVELEYWQAEAV